MSKYAVIFTFALLLVSILLTPVSAKSETAYIVASKDNTLIENTFDGQCLVNSTGELRQCSNGAGPYLFTGKTNQKANSLRRGLVHFDVAAAVPAGARIKSARLMLYLSKSGGFAAEISLHPVLTDWGQGASSATGGTGAPAQLDDATWFHTFYPDMDWATMGGDYVMDASAVLTVAPDAGSYTWESRDMADDVQSWLMNPAENYGWILIGDEDTPQSVMRFSSREVTCSDRTLSTEVPPILVVDYK